MNNLQHIGAALTGVAALATASVTVYSTVYKQDTSSNIQTNKRTGVIYDKDGWTNLRQLPTTNAKIISKLANDTKVYILNQSGNWYQVETKNNLIGFIYTDNFLETN